MAGTSEKIDIEKAKKAAEHVLNLLGGAVVSGMIYLGESFATVEGGKCLLAAALTPLRRECFGPTRLGRNN